MIFLCNGKSRNAEALEKCRARKLFSLFDLLLEGSEFL